MSNYIFATMILAFAPLLAAAAGPTTHPSTESEGAWVEPMRKVHAKFTGKPGTLAHFGDSITVSLAYWAPLRWSQKNLDPAGKQAYEVVNAYMLKDCWDKWRGPSYGNEGGMTIRWARENVDGWLKELNPEVALIMFGTNDIGQLKLDEYQAKTREVVQRCLDNGTIVILSTIPPRSGRLEQSRQFADAVTKTGRDMKVPVVDYFEECLKRRPDDWDGTLAKFKSAPGDVYQVPTLISRDGVHPSNPKGTAGDFSEEALSQNGFGLRTYLTLRAYADVIQSVLKRPG